MERQLLTIYLSDHLSGATGAVRRLSQMASGYTDLSVHDDLVTLAEDVAQDRQALVGIMEQVGVRPQRYKLVAGRVGETVGRLKGNGRILSRSPLTPLVEIEAIRVGVVGKLSLWQTLGTHAESLGLEADHLAELHNRATSQLRVIERCHGELTQGAFSD